MKRKWISVGMVFVMVLELITNRGTSAREVKAAETDYGLSNPRVEMLTRDVIEFGRYWQEDERVIIQTSQGKA